MRKFITKSVDETEKLAFDLAKSINNGKVIELIGDLGAGKTAFAKGFAKGLGIEQPITSPTFALLNTYYGRITLNHFDLYRLEDLDELYMLGFDEIFSDSNSISLIEWPQIAEEILPKNKMIITLNKVSETEREIIIEEK